MLPLSEFYNVYEIAIIWFIIIINDYFLFSYFLIFSILKALLVYIIINTWVSVKYDELFQE